MNPPRSRRRLLLVALCAGVLGGCAHRPPVGTRAPDEPAAESLAEVERSARQPLVVSKDARYGYDTLEVPGVARAHPIALYLRPAEAAGLRALAPGAEVEIRYWEHPARSLPDSRNLSVGELISVRQGPLLVIDRALCERHSERMSRQPATLVYGLLAPDFAQSWATYFPNAALSPGGSVVTEHSPVSHRKYVCPTCDQAFRAWEGLRRGN